MMKNLFLIILALLLAIYFVATTPVLASALIIAGMITLVCIIVFLFLRLGGFIIF